MGITNLNKIILFQYKCDRGVNEASSLRTDLYLNHWVCASWIRTLKLNYNTTYTGTLICNALFVGINNHHSS